MLGRLKSSKRSDDSELSGVKEIERIQIQDGFGAGNRVHDIAAFSRQRCIRTHG